MSRRSWFSRLFGKRSSRGAEASPSLGPPQDPSGDAEYCRHRDRGLRKLATGRVEEALKADAPHPHDTYNRGPNLWRSACMSDEELVRQVEVVRGGCFAFPKQRQIKKKLAYTLQEEESKGRMIRVLNPSSGTGSSS